MRLFVLIKHGISNFFKIAFKAIKLLTNPKNLNSKQLYTLPYRRIPTYLI